MSAQQKEQAAFEGELKWLPEDIGALLEEVVNPERAIETLSVGPNQAETRRLIDEGAARLGDDEQLLRPLRQRLETAVKNLAASCEKVKQSAKEETCQ